MSTTTTDTEKQQIKEAIVNIVSELFEELNNQPILFNGGITGTNVMFNHIVSSINEKVNVVTHGQPKYISVEVALLNYKEIITALPELRQTRGIQIVCKVPEYEIDLAFAIHHAPHLSTTGATFFPYIQPIESKDYTVTSVCISDMPNILTDMGEKQ